MRGSKQQKEELGTGVGGNKTGGCNDGRGGEADGSDVGERLSLVESRKSAKVKWTFCDRVQEKIDQRKSC